MAERQEKCANCVKLRKRLESTDEREKLLAKGIDYLLKEIRKLSGTKAILNPRRRNEDSKRREGK